MMILDPSKEIHVDVQGAAGRTETLVIGPDDRLSMDAAVIEVEISEKGERQAHPLEPGTCDEAAALTRAPVDAAAFRRELITLTEEAARAGLIPLQGGSQATGRVACPRLPAERRSRGMALLVCDTARGRQGDRSAQAADLD